MINGCCQEGLLEEAKYFLQTMEQKSCIPDRITYNIIVRGFLLRSNFDEAANFLDEMEERELAFDSSIFSLLLDLFQTTEHNHTLLRMIQKFTPSTLKVKL